MGIKAHICQVCYLYVQEKSNLSIDDVFIESKKIAEKKIKEKAELFKLEEIQIDEDLDLSTDEFNEDDDALPIKFEKRKIGKGEIEDSEEFAEVECPFCGEIFDDLTSHIKNCEFAPDDASIDDIRPTRLKKRKKRKKPSATTKSEPADKTEIKEKKKCPHCGKEFIRLGRHLNSCKKNPEIINK